MFAAIWSHDHKPQPPKLRTVVAYEFPKTCPVDPIEPVTHAVNYGDPGREQVSKRDFLVDLVASEIAVDELKPLKANKPRVIRVNELSFPLPRNLTAGQYRIIDRFGNIESLSISQDDLVSWGITREHNPRNAYEVCVGEDRWHFIRVEHPVDPAPTQAEIAAAWKSVFRFASRKVTSTIEKASTPMQRWLGGELDLSGKMHELR
jgi:hypothetical protein